MDDAFTSSNTDAFLDFGQSFRREALEQSIELQGIAVLAINQSNGLLALCQEPLDVLLRELIFLADFAHIRKVRFVLLIQPVQELFVVTEDIPVIFDTEIPFEIHAERIPVHRSNKLLADFALQLVLLHNRELKQLFDIFPHNPVGKKLGAGNDTLADFPRNHRPILIYGKIGIDDVNVRVLKDFDGVFRFLDGIKVFDVGLHFALNLGKMPVQHRVDVAEVPNNAGILLCFEAVIHFKQQLSIFKELARNANQISDFRYDFLIS